MAVHDLTPEQQERARLAQTPEELEELAKENGQELSDDQLESMSGGGITCAHCPSLCLSLDSSCKTKVDMSGKPCPGYSFR